MDRILLCRAVEVSLSRERLLAYGKKEDSDNFNAVARYVWNTALCEALYPTIQCFEIVLRNAIHDSLCDYYRPDWLLDNGFLRSYEQEGVNKAEEELQSQSKTVTPGRIVAELPLGFWTGLFVAQYDRQVAIPLMKKGLRNFPDSLRTRRVLSERFERVRYLRNRVAHDANKQNNKRRQTLRRNAAQAENGIQNSGRKRDND